MVEIKYSKGIAHIVLLLVVVVAAIGGIGYLMYQNGQLSRQNEQLHEQKTETTSTNATVSTPTPDPTADWETYTNTEYGFQFKHPNLNPDCCSIAGPADWEKEDLLTLANHNPKSLGGTDRKFDGFAVYVVEKDTNTSFDKFMSQYRQDIIDSYAYSPYKNPDEIIKVKDIDVGGQNGEMHTGYDLLGIERYFIPSPDGNYIVLISNIERSNTSEWNNLFNQILSTFEFNK